MRTRVLLVCVPFCALVGCGAASPGCVYTPVLSLGPVQATVSSAAKAPANQQVFTAGLGETATGTGCAIPAVIALVHPSWANPDPIHISISSADDATNGTAVCEGPTAGAVTLTALILFGATTVTSSVQLTCT